jgi:hypothetical protein
MAMNPAGFATKNDSAGKRRHQFTRPITLLFVYLYPPANYFVFYAVRAVSEESRLLVLPRTCLFMMTFLFLMSGILEHDFDSTLHRDMSWDSAVGIATGYELDDRGRSLSPGRVKNLGPI